jgi:hypothetical protein
MYFSNVILCILLFISSNLSAQIQIPDAGDAWKQKVDSAIQLIKETDTTAYRILMENCKEVEFIIGNYSTTKPPYTIAITTADMKLNSINNIACVLVHESCHLYVFNHSIKLENDKEEYLCYMKEYDFVCKLQYVEHWLFQSVMNNLLYYRAKIE